MIAFSVDDVANDFGRAEYLRQQFYPPELQELDPNGDLMIQLAFNVFEFSDCRYTPNKDGSLQATFSTSTPELRPRQGVPLCRPVDLVLDTRHVTLEGDGCHAAQNSLYMNLAGLNLVDASKASWEQVEEFRKDLDSVRKLRNLRLALNQDLKGKSDSYIEDFIFQKIDEYNQAVSRWGFETGLGNLKTMFSSSLIPSSVAAIAGATLGPNPLAGIMAGGMTTFAGISIEFGQKLWSLSKFKQDHPYAFLIEANAAFNDDDNSTE